MLWHQSTDGRKYSRKASLFTVHPSHYSQTLRVGFLPGEQLPACPVPPSLVWAVRRHRNTSVLTLTSHSTHAKNEALLSPWRWEPSPTPARATTTADAINLIHNCKIAKRFVMYSITSFTQRPFFKLSHGQLLHCIRVKIKMALVARVHLNAHNWFNGNMVQR